MGVGPCDRFFGVFCAKFVCYKEKRNIPRIVLGVECSTYLRLIYYVFIRSVCW